MSCPPGAVIYDELRGEYICTETGEVILDHAIDLGPEWRAFTPEDQQLRTRGGTQLTSKVHDNGFATYIDRRSRKGRKLDDSNRKNRIRNSRERRLVKALSLMNDVIGRLNLPEIVNESAGMLIKKLFSKGLIKKRNMNAFVAASIILATRNLGIPVNKKLVLEACQVTNREVWNAELKITRDSGEFIRVRTIDPRTYLEKMANNLNLSPQTLTLAARILHVAKKEGITSGRGPIGMAAAALYIASVFMDEKHTQRDISVSADVSEVTVRNRYRDIIDNLVMIVSI